ncbi:MAG TPA: CDGSH iron-sulfur domain-containing protein [Bacteroidota bacterium]|nr:CDGSH iron-sulfur domain-containing protein [Bacteroidota bacterium]
MTTIMIKSNGSIKVEGEFRIVDQDGNVFDLAGRTAVSLCRCGQSENKPFCDGRHRTCGFSSEIRAFGLPPAQPK